MLPLDEIEKPWQQTLHEGIEEMRKETAAASGMMTFWHRKIEKSLPMNRQMQEKKRHANVIWHTAMPA